MIFLTFIDSTAETRIIVEKRETDKVFKHEEINNLTFASLVKLKEKYQTSLNFNVSLSYVAILVITCLIILFISFDICKIVSLFKIQRKKIKKNDFLEQINSNKERTRK
jgi:hypothetical protein